jgi:hypothetical protein
MDHRRDVENNRKYQDFVSADNSMRHSANLEEFGMEEEFHIPENKRHPSIRERLERYDNQ